MPPDQSEGKEGSYVAVRLVSGLKEVFTFKELEEMLGIPAQVLWRYTSHVQFPERATAKKIIDTIESRRLLEQAVRKIVAGPPGLAEEWRLLFNPRFLNLVGYVAWRDFGSDEVDLVLAPSEKDAALAVVIADWLGAGACAATERAWVSWGKLYTAPYGSSERGEVIYLHVPRGALEKDSKVLVVRGVTRNFESLHAIASIIEQARAKLAGALIVLALGGGWAETAAKVGLGKVRVIAQVTEKGLLVSL